MIEIETNLIPPSVNAYWRTSCRGNFPVVYISKKGADFKKAMGLIAHSKIKEPLVGDVKVEIEYHITGKVGKDIDNILKGILDSLNKIAYEDDKNIVELSVRKIRKSTANKLIIRIDNVC